MHSTPAAEARPGSAGPAGEMGADGRGLNFYDVDRGLQDLLALHAPPRMLDAARGELRRLGHLAGTRLDELAFTADAHPPRLHTRDRYGRDEDWIEYHPAYRELERHAYLEFGMHAIGRRGGLLGCAEPLPLLFKYACQYLFVQAEFGLVCPVAMTDSCAHVVQAHADEAVRALFLDGLTSTDPARLLKGAQMMTERQAGSDVGLLRTAAVRDPEGWRITGEKWFCSAADADVIMVLARSDLGSRGTAGLSLFAVPRVLPGGSRNAYAIRRLKDKLGTRSMPTGEIEFAGARGYLVGAEGRGLKIILEQVNMSRLSHGARAAGMMRRCLNEALAVARTRRAFGRLLVDMPVVAMQLLRLKLAAEEALSLVFATAVALQQSSAGDARQGLLVRILTPLVKLGACRDNVEMATAAMELRGGNGFIADHVNERLVRDAQTGLLWEGTSNIIAQDLFARAVGRERAHVELFAWLRAGIADATGAAPELPLFRELSALLDSLEPRIEAMARLEDPVGGIELGMRLYHAVAACLLAIEGSRLARNGGNAQRLLLAHWTLRTRAAPSGDGDMFRPALVAAALRDDALPLAGLQQIGFA